MIERKSLINKLSTFQKIICIIFMLVFIWLLAASISIPSFANTSTNVYVSTDSWDESWNDLRFELNTTRLYSNLTFSIRNIENLTPYYYISNEPLTQADIDQIDLNEEWIPYSAPIEETIAGTYVIYVKVVDASSNTTYMNTDILILDLGGSAATISIDDNLWSNLRDSLDYVHIDREKVVTIETDDELSGISSIKYHIADEIQSIEELDLLDSGEWTTYYNGEEILIDEVLYNEPGTHIIYVQVVDNLEYTTYVNTDYIILDGYASTLTVGRNPTSYGEVEPYITNKSIVTLNFSYSSLGSELTNHTHNFISNMLLPLGTKLTLIDHITENVYKYQIPTEDDIYGYNDSCDPEDLDCIKVATYPLALFKKVGTVTTVIPYTESTYYIDGTINENFTVVLDLGNTNITTNHENIMLYMALHDPDGNNVRPTLYSTIETFNIYSNVGSDSPSATLSLSTDYSGNAIIYNSESVTNINITSGLDYKYVNETRIIDTTYEDKEMGISIKFIDSEGNTIDKEYLKNIIFKVGNNNIYYPEEGNIVRINLNSGIADVTKVLTIITKENNGNLEEGIYYFKISNYVAVDGYYYDGLGGTELTIPVNVSDNNDNIVHGFDVIMDDENRIISKVDQEVNVLFEILFSSYLEEPNIIDDPNIRVSLYKKDELTAYNQSYSIVDLADFVSDELDMYEENIYYVTTNPVQYAEPDYLYNNFELNLITTNFENTGYKYVFDLYDGTKKIGTIEKYFIVKEG